MRGMYGRAEGAAKVLFGNSDARAAILGLMALSKSAYATGRSARWERQGTRFDASEMRSVIGALVPVARALGGA